MIIRLKTRWWFDWAMDLLNFYTYLTDRKVSAKLIEWIVKHGTYTKVINPDD